jgi:hypothetical protein
MAADPYSFGFSLVISSTAIFFGLFGAGIFFFANQAFRTDIDNTSKLLISFISVCLLIAFLISVLTLNSVGMEYINLSKSFEQNSNISINLSCTNEVNCTASIPNRLQISCQDCIIPTPCPTPTPAEKQFILIRECPPLLLLPQI